MKAKTPICPVCNHKFPGDPCRFCKANEERQRVSRLHRGIKGSARRRKRSHGRQVIPRNGRSAVSA